MKSKIIFWVHIVSMCICIGAVGYNKFVNEIDPFIIQFVICTFILTSVMVILDYLNKKDKE